MLENVLLPQKKVRTEEQTNTLTDKACRKPSLSHDVPLSELMVSGKIPSVPGQTLATYIFKVQPNHMMSIRGSLYIHRRREKQQKDGTRRTATSQDSA